MVLVDLDYSLDKLLRIKRFKRKRTYKDFIDESFKAKAA
jgi:hypothetical protein